MLKFGGLEYLGLKNIYFFLESRGGCCSVDHRADV